MAYLNKSEREALYDELKNMKFNQAKWKLSRLDPKGRLAFLRNAQATGKLLTRYELAGLGTRVTLVEEHNTKVKDAKIKGDYVLVDVIVEPTPDNRT